MYVLCAKRPATSEEFVGAGAVRLKYSSRGSHLQWRKARKGTVRDTSGPGFDIVAERGLTKTQRTSLKETVALYERFLGMPMSIIGRPGLAF
jgi:hypothetical protein